MLFQSTLPARGATKILLPVPLPSTFQSTLPARGATGERFPMSYLDNYFNPHSPRGERHEGYDVITRSDYISIHTPREGSDHMQSCKNKPDHAFQSTLPARGATRSSNLLHSFGVNFNPHSPRGERPKGQIPTWIRFDFNPHSPRGERLPLSYSEGEWEEISIHTPREGSDLLPLQHGLPPRHFNPHSPRGERPQIWGMFLFGRLFQSTLPARGATAVCIPVRSSNDISIHTPREGSDQRMIHGVQMLGYFNPHSPRGERPQGLMRRPGTVYFNPHSPRGERQSALQFPVPG